MSKTNAHSFPSLCNLDRTLWDIVWPDQWQPNMFDPCLAFNIGNRGYQDAAPNMSMTLGKSTLHTSIPTLIKSVNTVHNDFVIWPLWSVILFSVCSTFELGLSPNRVLAKICSFIAVHQPLLTWAQCQALPTSTAVEWKQLVHWFDSLLPYRVSDSSLLRERWQPKVISPLLKFVRITPDH